MTSKFIQDILAEMESEINKVDANEQPDDVEQVEEQDEDKEEPIEEGYDINAMRDLISKSGMQIGHANKTGNTGLADKIASRLKGALDNAGYNWKQDPAAMEILGDYIEEADKKLASSGRGEQAKQQLNSIWSKLSSVQDITMVSDEDLDKMTKILSMIEKNKARQQASQLKSTASNFELAPKENPGQFFNQRQIRDSKEFAQLDVMRESFIQELRVLLENEVEQAEVLMASKGFSEELQVMIEKLGRLMNEKLPPVIDQMRLAYGSEQADVFGETMRSDMQSILDTLLAVRENIDHAVLSISQGKMPHEETDMDADGNLSDPSLGDAGMDVDPSTDLQDELGGLADEFGGDEAMSGPEEDPLGREKKESVQNLKNQLTEMRKKIAQVKNSK